MEGAVGRPSFKGLLIGPLNVKQGRGWFTGVLKRLGRTRNLQRQPHAFLKNSVPISKWLRCVAAWLTKTSDGVASRRSEHQALSFSGILLHSCCDCNASHRLQDVCQDLQKRGGRPAGLFSAETLRLRNYATWCSQTFGMEIRRNTEKFSSLCEIVSATWSWLRSDCRRV